MEIHPNIEIEDLEGQPIPITEQKGICPHCGGELVVKSLQGVVHETGKNITLKSVCVNALLGTYPDEKNISGVKKCERATLAEKIFLTKDKVRIVSDDITLLKRLIALSNSPLIVKRAFEFFDPPEELEEPEENSKVEL